MLSEEQELSSMSLLEMKCSEESLMLWVTPSMEKALLIPLKETELKLKLLVLFLENQSMNLCKLVLNLLIVWFLLVEDKENLLLEIDKPVKLPLLLIPS
jgi:hypothetical protein